MALLKPRLGQAVVPIMSDTEEPYGRIVGVIKRDGNFNGRHYFCGEVVIKKSDGQVVVYHQAWLRPHITDVEL